MGAGASVFLIGVAGVSIVALAATVFAAGFCVIGGQIGANATTAAFYPTQIRSTGVGWALGMGRLGSIFGPRSAACCCLCIGTEIHFLGGGLACSDCPDLAPDCSPEH